MKVYLITSGSYSDYRVDGVCISREVAEEIVKRNSQLLGGGSYSDYGIEEQEIVESPDEVQTHTVWEVYIDKDGNRLEDQAHSRLVTKFPTSEYVDDLLKDEAYDLMYYHEKGYKQWGKNAFGAQSARGKEVAYKIAQDKRAEYLAKRAGIS